MDPTIECPECKTEIKLTETLAAPIIEAERTRVEASYKTKVGELADREKALGDREQKMNQVAMELEKTKAEVDATVERRLEAERKEIAKAEAEKAAGAVAAEVTALKEESERKGAKLVEAQAAELEVRKRATQLEEDRRQLELTVERRLGEERAKIRDQAAKDASEPLETKLKHAEEELAQKDVKLKQAEETEIQARKAREEAEEAKRTVELEVARRVDEERQVIRDHVRKEDDDQFRLKLAEKDKVITDMQKQLDEARRKSEQGSQQTQGDVAEVDLECLLKGAFPQDDIEPIGKGREGADRLQHVRIAGEPVAGTILWERKRTKAWSNDWLEKARDDQRKAKANLVVIVSDALPKGVAMFDRVEGVWVTSPACSLPLAASLRQGLIDSGMARRANEGRLEKEALVYGFVTGTEFHQRVGLMVEAILSMQTQHEKEKAAMQRIWAERERQHDRLMAGTASVYGGFRGLVGASLPDVKGLSLPEPVPKPVPAPDSRDMDIETKVLAPPSKPAA